MRYARTPSPEVAAAVKRLQPLVDETCDAIATLALRGARALDNLSADEHGHHFQPTSSPGGLFRNYLETRRVTPKIDADRSLRGYHDLLVVGAQTRRSATYDRFQHMYVGAHPIAVPFTRSVPSVELILQSQGSVLPEGWYDRGRAWLGISAAGFASFYSQTDTTLPRPLNYEVYETVGELEAEYYRTFPEALAITGLVAHGLRSYDNMYGAGLDTKPAQLLLNEWRTQAGLPPAPDPFWTCTTNGYLQRHLQPATE